MAPNAMIAVITIFHMLQNQVVMTAITAKWAVDEAFTFLFVRFNFGADKFLTALSTNLFGDLGARRLRSKSIFQLQLLFMFLDGTRLKFFTDALAPFFFNTMHAALKG